MPVGKSGIPCSLLMLSHCCALPGGTHAGVAIGGRAGECAKRLARRLAGCGGAGQDLHQSGRPHRRKSRARSREGSGIVIDDNGLVLTIGYLMVEAHAAEIRTASGRAIPADIVGYDYESGFGLLRTIEPLKIKPMPIGKSADVKERDRLLIASYGGSSAVLPVHVISIREFAGSWEYLLDDAIFTGAAASGLEWRSADQPRRQARRRRLADRRQHHRSQSTIRPATCSCRSTSLPPVLADLIADGRPSGAARPWLGITTAELRGRLVVGQVTPGGPAEKAGISRGDQIVGVNGVEAKTLAELYRQIWAQGAAGVSVPLDVIQNNQCQARRRAVDEPARPPQAEIDLLTAYN